MNNKKTETMVIKLLFTTFLATLCYGQEFRYDYTYSNLANGWLKLHQVPAVWNEARLRCHAEGAVLASPLNTNLKNAIVYHVLQRQRSAYTIFTGVHSSFSKGDYASVEGVPLERLPISWTRGEPDNLNNNEGCLVMLTLNNGTVADARCNDVFPYVCYKQSTPLVITACGTHDPEYNLDTRTGSCYKFHRRGLTWSRAYMTCVGEGGHLAIINSHQESTVLKELYAKNPDNTIFSKDPGYAAIGFHDWDERGMWMTIHGQTLTQAGFDKFAPGQPDNSTRARTGDVGEFCGSIFRSGQLNDIWCNVIIPFICEKSPTSLSLTTEDLSNVE